MSIIDKILVLLDDESQKSLNEIKTTLKQYSKQVVAASLGRLCSKGLIKKNNSIYQITTAGRNIITKNLTNIENVSSNYIAKQCMVIIFKIPEKERINRDIMRNFLLANGFGRLHNTVWISLYDQTSKIKNIINELKIENKVLIFNLSTTKKKIIDIINFSKWNIDIVNNKYTSFIKQTNNYLKSKHINNFESRCLVYQYSKIVREDPMLPQDSKHSHRYKGNTAHKAYLKIRKYC
jgi:DNA-binding transcriptional regulator PaaX